MKEGYNGEREKKTGIRFSSGKQRKRDWRNKGEALQGNDRGTYSRKKGEKEVFWSRWLEQKAQKTLGWGTGVNKLRTGCHLKNEKNLKKGGGVASTREG